MKVLIAGGGIAGPAAAIALDKAGIGAEVFEAYPEDTDGTGAFLTLTDNGQDALRAIDAGPALFAASFPATRLRVFSPSGDLLADAPLGRDHPCPRTITRAALSGLLRTEAAARGIPVRYGRRVASAVAGPDGRVTVTCDDGTRATGDLLIGADGIHSPVRALIDRDAPAPRYTGLTIACGYTQAPPPAAAGTEGFAMYYGSRAFFGCTAAPDGRTWWFARVPGLPAAGPGAYDADRIAAEYDGDRTPAARLIRSTPGPLTVTSAFDLAHLPTWRSDAMLVIGDAAHATSPMTTQGASLAIEDAVVLARCLRDIPRQADALATYERLRRSRVEGIVRSGASGENPVPSAPGPRQAGPAGPAYTHHVDWDARISPADVIASDPR
jgi:2-polyprenyl-6-methoxyphenol hydroxylase-like FAD-dependent oxidoreductase